MTGAFSRLFNDDLKQKVYSLTQGRVLKSGWQLLNNPNAGAGWRVQILTTDKNSEYDGYRFLYGHMEPESTPDVGTLVRGGQFIGNYADPTNGHSSGPHVHVQVFDTKGNIVEPPQVSPVSDGIIRSNYSDTGAMHQLPHKGIDYGSP